MVSLYPSRQRRGQDYLAGVFFFGVGLGVAAVGPLVIGPEGRIEGGGPLAAAGATVCGAGRLGSAGAAPK
jgi:hypothetical protein